MASTVADAPTRAAEQRADQPSSCSPAATSSDKSTARESAENNNHTATAPAPASPPHSQNGHVADAPNGLSSPPPPPHEPSSPRGVASHLKHRLNEKADSVKEKKPAGGFDTTPLPDFPAGYTVKITFHSAANLPRGDFTTASSDPFVHATLTADVPRRHKEDPVLTFRTRTLRRTTEPEWEQEWVVANVPRSGFKLKCRIYDEDYPDNDDRLGNVTYVARRVDEDWEGIARRTFQAKKRVGSKRAYLVKAVESAFTKNGSLTPRLTLSVEVLCRSDGPGAQMYTVGPTAFVQHFSPMIGRLTGTKVNRDEVKDEQPEGEEASKEGTKEGEKSHDSDKNKESDDRQTKKYDFQACEMQLRGPVPPRLYHRYVEFSRFVAPMFSSRGLRGTIMNKVLHKQHRRVYNFDQSTRYGTFAPCSTEAALQFLRLAHFDEGGRIFTYVLTLDGLFRFTETGKEFGIDMLSKHTMHSDVTTYIACSGEFFIRRRRHTKRHDDDDDAAAAATADPNGTPTTHPPDKPPASPSPPPPPDPRLYQLVIDNDSGTYRPDKSCLPGLEAFLSRNFPGLAITALHWEDEHLKAMKAAQHEAKKKQGGGRIRMVLNRSPTSSSFSSSDESRLSDMDYGDDDDGLPARKTKKELAFDVLENPSRIRETLGVGGGTNSSSSSEKKHAAVASPEEAAVEAKKNPAFP